MSHGARQERSTEDRQTTLAFVCEQTPTSAAERRVTGERIRTMVSHAKTENVLAVVFACAGALVLWGTVEHTRLYLWCAIMLLPALAREFVRRAYERTAVDIRDSVHPAWARRLGACSAAAGAAWGGVVLLLPAAADAPGVVMTLIALHVAHVAVASGLQAAYLPALLAFVLPSTLAFLLLVSGASDPGFVRQAASLLVAAGIVSAISARRNARSLVTSIARRFEHEETAVRLVTERDRAELAMLAKNRFLAAASHDLRQPLHAIGLYAGSLSRRLDADDTDGVLDKMQRSIGALSALFDGILDVSRLDADAMESAPRPVPLDPLLQRLECEYGMQAHAKGLSLKVDTRTDLIAHVDPTLLERVLINLIGNAIKFTETGEVAVTVRREDGGLSLSVRDTGCGIPEADRERVFSEYRQLQDTDRAGCGGRGLGLAIVRRLCPLMGGSIELHSSAGRGSEFVVSIPRSVVDDAAVMTDRARLADAPLWCRSALVIDGEQAILDGTRRILSHLGCRSVTARTTEEALRRHAGTRGRDAPDVLIVDVGLRGGDSGLEAVRRIRETFDADIPALLTTGDSACRYAAGRPTGRVRLLHKPCTPDRLREELIKLGTRGGERIARRSRPEVATAP